MIKISIIGDSLPMPRITEEEEILIEQTWPSLLQNHLQKINNEVLIVNFSERRRSSVSFKNSSLYSEAIDFVKPDILLMQVGVVDAAPRIFSSKEYALINHKYFPHFLRNIIIRSRKVRRNKIQEKDRLRKVYTPLPLFTKYWEFFFSKVEREIKIIVIPILGDLERMDNKSYGFKQNILDYNSQLKLLSTKRENVFFLDSLNLDHIHFCQDHYHLSIIGHKVIANEIVNKLSGISSYET